MRICAAVVILLLLWPSDGRYKLTSTGIQLTASGGAQDVGPVRAILGRVTTSGNGSRSDKTTALRIGEPTCSYAVIALNEVRENCSAKEYRDAVERLARERRDAFSFAGAAIAEVAATLKRHPDAYIYHATNPPFPNCDRWKFFLVENPSADEYAVMVKGKPRLNRDRYRRLVRRFLSIRSMYSRVLN